ncbi:MAG TPA: methylated-DNA--[protein]-cysteine S-methyltransferase [Bryobacteraceae bacterium]|nr:methylated-DNA--[protein]-cysteine S-methyltransferase [Bryobacteraceae bacterium]
MQFKTPFGPAWASIDADGAVTEFGFGVGEGSGHSVALARQLKEFFAGERQDFDIPLAPKGTAFQKRVWAELVKIPFGETISYGQLARRIGNPSASRAVGRANGTNPIALIVPCHRVIGSDGSLTGYGGGLDLKEKLLAWERNLANPALFELSAMTSAQT